MQIEVLWGAGGEFGTTDKTGMCWFFLSERCHQCFQVVRGVDLAVCLLHMADPVRWGGDGGSIKPLGVALGAREWGIEVPSLHMFGLEVLREGLGVHGRGIAQEASCLFAEWLFLAAIGTMWLM